MTRRSLFDLCATPTFLPSSACDRFIGLAVSSASLSALAVASVVTGAYRPDGKCDRLAIALTCVIKGERFSHEKRMSNL